jgi:hypothetical protein
MFTRLRSAFWLAMVGCLLTVAASGDDFCLVRVALPTFASASIPLPLDDPNSDFVEHGASADGAKVRGNRQRDTDAAGDHEAAGVRVRISFLSTPRFSSVAPHFLPDHTTPLLC